MLIFSAAVATITPAAGNSPGAAIPYRYLIGIAL
jgi:hypothetical protein